jgi:rhodanese-related sulfurtransferase
MKSRAWLALALVLCGGCGGEEPASCKSEACTAAGGQAGTSGTGGSGAGAGAAGSAAGGAAGAPADALTDFASLADQLGSGSVDVIDARTQTEYDAGHIPGALQLDVKALSTLDGAPNQLIPPEQLAQAFAQKGVRSDRTAVVYGAEVDTTSGRIGVNRAGSWRRRHVGPFPTPLSSTCSGCCPSCVSCAP